MSRLVFFFILLPFYLTGQQISSEKAIEDLKEFQHLVNYHSSYYQIEGNQQAVDKGFKDLENQLAGEDSIQIFRLYFEFEKIIAELPDRHANVRFDDFKANTYPISSLRFPITLARFENKIVGLTKEGDRYVFYNSKFPFVSKIDGLDIEVYINKYAYRRKNAPQSAKLTNSTRDLRDIGKLYLKQGVSAKKEITLTFENKKGKKDEEKFTLNNDRKSWKDIGVAKANEIGGKMHRKESFELSELFQVTEDSIGVFTLPSMASETDVPGITRFIMHKLEACLYLKGVIIDVRDNGGGSRNILHLFSPYIIEESQSPWIANVSYVRTNTEINKDMGSMKSRFLYFYDSEKFTDDDRLVIDAFNEKFSPQVNFDASKFSTPFYMLLRSGKEHITSPIYILENERSFSAASVFVTAFKGLKNVKIVGVNSDGSSGRSKKFYLKNSNIRIKLSTMLSLQRNGYPLDAYGTGPDIVIDRNLDQLFGMKDFQLEEALRLIQEEKMD